jgi:hypothetical protein
VVIYKAFLSTHNATSHLWHFTETFLATTLAEHTQHLCMGDKIGQCFLPHSSNLTTWIAAAGVQPFGLCTFLSSPACTDIFPSRFIRKSLCEIFLPPRVPNQISYPVWRQEPGCTFWCTHDCWLRKEPVYQVLMQCCALLFQLFYGSQSLYLYISNWSLPVRLLNYCIHHGKEWPHSAASNYLYLFVWVKLCILFIVFSKRSFRRNAESTFWTEM